MGLAFVVGIVERGGEDLKRTGEVHEVEVLLQGDENVNGFISHCRSLGCHLADFACWNTRWGNGMVSLRSKSLDRVLRRTGLQLTGRGLDGRGGEKAEGSGISMVFVD